MSGESEKEGPPLCGWPSFSKIVRRRPTLPPRPQGSTIGAEGLSFRVRNGTGRFPFAIVPPKLYGDVGADRDSGPTTASREPHSGRELPRRRTPKSTAGRMIFVASPRPISTGQLHALPHFHFRPINPLFWRGPYQVDPVGDLILKRASRLDAFSGYPFRT